MLHEAAWLGGHPERELITARYLKHQKRLTHEALSRLIGQEEPEADEVAETHAREEKAIEGPISLAEQWLGAVMAALRNSGEARRRSRLWRREASARAFERQDFLGNLENRCVAPHS